MGMKRDFRSGRSVIAQSKITLVPRLVQSLGKHQGILRQQDHGQFKVSPACRVRP